MNAISSLRERARLRPLLRGLLAAGLGLNGLGMLLAPQAWYRLMPGVEYTGPLNLHFVRDIGCAYLVAGLGLAWQTWRPHQGGPAALAGAGFLALHAGVHAWELMVGLCGWGQFLRDVPAVVLAALLALGLAWPGGRDA